MFRNLGFCYGITHIYFLLFDLFGTSSFWQRVANQEFKRNAHYQIERERIEICHCRDSGHGLGVLQRYGGWAPCCCGGGCGTCGCRDCYQPRAPWLQCRCSGGAPYACHHFAFQFCNIYRPAIYIVYSFSMQRCRSRSRPRDGLPLFCSTHLDNVRPIIGLGKIRSH